MAQRLKFTHFDVERQLEFVKLLLCNGDDFISLEYGLRVHDVKPVKHDFESLDKLENVQLQIVVILLHFHAV